MGLLHQSEISVAFLIPLQAYAESLKVDFNSAAKRTGLNPALVKDGSAKIPAHQFERAWLEIAARGKDPYPGLRFGKKVAEHYPTGSILFSMMQNSKTIAAALDLFVRYHRIMADTIQPCYQVENEVVRISWDYNGGYTSPGPYLSEVLLCALFSIFDRISSGNFKVVGVNILHIPQQLSIVRSEYEELFGTTVNFGAERNEIIIDESMMRMSIDLADDSLLGVLEKHAYRLIEAADVQNGWTRRVALSMKKTLLSGQVPYMDAVSSELALSRRSLQARLHEEKSSFRRILQTVRMELAEEFLADPGITLCEIALLLGFSDQSAFNHAYKKWTGKSPTWQKRS